MELETLINVEMREWMELQQLKIIAEGKGHTAALCAIDAMLAAGDANSMELEDRMILDP